MPALTVPVGEFDLEQTLESGQCFRWRRISDREYWGVVGKDPLHVRQETGELHVSFCGGDRGRDLTVFVSRYFDLACDYRIILRRLRRDNVFARFAPPQAKLHILSQDPFETLISFIISANNHIPRIRSIIERVCRHYGSPLATTFGTAYTFPTPERLASARREDLRLKCGLGYRDAYVQAVARTIVDQSDFARWVDLPTPELRQQLLQLDGVGEKVADCILLFGYHRLEAFPVDTWIRRAMMDLYFPVRTPSLREIRSFAAERFGAYAGVAQQYLFVQTRTADSSQRSAQR